MFTTMGEPTNMGWNRAPRCRGDLQYRDKHGHCVQTMSCRHSYNVRTCTLSHYSSNEMVNIVLNEQNRYSISEQLSTFN